MAAMAIFGKCTYSTVTHGALQLPTLVYWGFEPPLFLFNAGVLLWSVAALLFICPWWAATNILLVGGVNLLILQYIDATILSKLCCYCLQLSILWLLEPSWAPKGDQQEGPSRIEISRGTTLRATRVA